MVLVFSVTGCKHFHGYAHLIGDMKNLPAMNIRWIKRAELPFTETLNLINPLYSNLPVHCGHSGQVMLT